MLGSTLLAYPELLFVICTINTLRYIYLQCHLITWRRSEMFAGAKPPQLTLTASVDAFRTWSVVAVFTLDEHHRAEVAL
jgi:hypothetical protein